MKCYQSEEAIILNMKDAGCSRDTIDKFLNFLREGKTKEQLRLLSVHRCDLLEKLHQNQKKIDCLDFLIYQIEKTN